MIARRVAFAFLMAGVAGTVVFVLSTTPALAQLEYDGDGSFLKSNGTEGSTLSGSIRVFFITDVETKSVYPGCNDTDKICTLEFETGLLKSHTPGSGLWVFAPDGGEEALISIFDESENILFSGSFFKDVIVTRGGSGTLTAEGVTGRQGKKVRDFFEILSNVDWTGPLSAEYLMDEGCPRVFPECINFTHVKRDTIMTLRPLTVPEPSSALLFVSSLVPTVALLRRRRQHGVVPCSLPL